LSASMNDAIILMYSLMGFVTIGAYPFSIRKMLQEEGGDSHIGSWAIWFLSSVIGCLYAAYVVGDLPLTLLNLELGPSCSSRFGRRGRTRKRPFWVRGLSRDTLRFFEEEVNFASLR